MALPGALEQNPLLSDWIRFEGNRIVVHTGKVELGQGISTAIAMIAAEELDVPIEQLEIRTGSTAEGPNEFMTAGSMSVEGSGSAVRQACAEVRTYLVGIAAQRFGVDAASLVVEDGIIKHPATNDNIAYHDLVDGNLDITASGEATPKSHTEYRLIGKSTTRVDLRAKITGGQAYVQDSRPAGLTHGRIVRAPSNAYSLAGIDTSTVESMPGVLKVVVDGDFIGVVANSEISAIRAKQKLHGLVQWQVDPDARLPADIHRYLMENPGASLLVRDGTPTEDPLPERETGPDTISAIYKKPYHMHGSLGPSAALAEFSEGRLNISSHSQGPYVIRGAIAAALGMDPEDIVVEHAENAGCYGHNGADDAAMDAAMLARALPGVPVLLKWQREDEHAWEPYSPAMALRMEASLDDDGRVTHWNADIYSQTHSGRPIPHRSVSNLVAAWHKSNPVPRPEPRPGMGNHSGIHRNGDPYYEFPRRRIIKHLVKDQRVRTSSTRGLGAFGNVFAIESFMDELAHHAKMDPIAFRLRHLTDPRAIEVINRVRDMAAQYTPESRSGHRTGVGFGFARYKNRQTYAGVAMFVDVDEASLDIRLLHAAIAADAGQVIDRDGLTNQLEGGLIQASSWTLKEAVAFDEYASVSTDWDSYPILTFPEIPTVDVDIIDHPELPSMGAGEATQGPTPAAIANAVYDAVGIRLREIPFTTDRLRAAAFKE